MPLMICPKCNKFHYVPGECPAGAALRPRAAEEAKPAPVKAPKPSKRLAPVTKNEPEASAVTSGDYQRKPVSAPLVSESSPDADAQRPTVRPNYTRIEGATFVAEVPAGTELLTYGNRVLAAGPGLAPSIVTSKGLVPLMTPLAELKKGGRPRTVEDRAAYKADKERDRRARDKATKESK